MKKPKYYPNNWKEFSDAPSELFESIEYDEFMDWKIGGYEIPSSVAAIVRVRDLKTGRVKEHVYKYRHAARNKTKKLMESGNKEITIVQRDTVHFIYPKEKEYDIIFDE
jgi:hypothetical protein|tara:strand:+ start:137 stop:463 length:327 start_codon:yes stop_codon:yes gene_type:complete